MYTSLCPTSNANTCIKIPNFHVCFKKFTYFQACFRSLGFRDGTNTAKYCVEGKRYQRLSGEPFYLSASTQVDREIRVFTDLLNGRACVEWLYFTGPFTGKGYRNHIGINEILLAKICKPQVTIYKLTLKCERDCETTAGEIRHYFIWRIKRRSLFSSTTSFSMNIFFPQANFARF